MTGVRKRYGSLLGPEGPKGDPGAAWAPIVVPNGTDFNTIREPGVYIVPSSAAAATMLNWPTNRAGSMLVAKGATASATTQDVITYISTTSDTERWTRANLSTSDAASSWSPYAAGGWVKGILAGTSAARVNVDTYREVGGRMIPSRTYVDGLPGTGTGLLEVIVATGTAQSMQRYSEKIANDNVKVWHRFSLLTAGWAGIDWHSPPAGDGSAGLELLNLAGDNSTRVDAARAAAGGGIGTGGVAAVVVRLDHGVKSVKEKVLAIADAHALPMVLNLNHANLGLESNGAGTIPWSEIEGWNQYRGFEMANHGRTHADYTDMASIFEEIVGGADALEAAMQRVRIWSWHEHGSSNFPASDVPGDTGLNLGRSMDDFLRSFAGQCALRRHGRIEGKSSGFFVPLSGSPTVGESHKSIDRDTAAEVIADVTLAQDLGAGLTVYLHPDLLDKVNVGGSLYVATYNGDGSVDLAYPAGSSTHYADRAALKTWADANGAIVHLTTADFAAVCAHLAAERDAGRLMVLTTLGLGFADSSHSRRRNLLVKAGFAGDLTGWWSGISGWTISSPGDDVELTAPAGGGTLSQGMLLHSRFGWAMGGTHELLVWARATAPTTLTERIEQTGNPANWMAEKVHNVPGDNVLRPYRLNVAFPRDSNAGVLQLSTKLTAGGPLTIKRKPLLAAI